MYLRGLAKLGAGWESLVASVVGGALRSGSNSGAPANSVSTSVQTQVSPQISPVFVQQDSPRDSPVNAAPVSVPSNVQLPGTPTPQTGIMPGFDTAAGYLPTGTGNVPVRGNTTAASVGIVAALGLLAFSIFRKKGGARRRRSRR